jgi:LmbE family N-acetylglucosaminyl deacetylase
MILSPHLDDAVFSAWEVLSAPGTRRVVTAFAGVPAPGFVTDLDRAHGAADSAEWMLRRHADDRAVLALVGCDPIHLDLLEVQFRAYRNDRIRAAISQDPVRFLGLVVDEPGLSTDPADLADLLLPHIRDEPVIYGPAGIGRHPDHRDLALATVRLAERVPEVWLYADSPYYLFNGLPSWVVEERRPRAGEEVADALSALGLDPSRLDQTVVRLPPDSFEQKLRAMRRYGSEFPSVQADLARNGHSVDLMRYEVAWRVGDARP